jgi:undecaprenyl-diphosphatase
VPLVESLILGVVQGVTEFLPVSSDGHLVLFQSLFQMEAAEALAVNVALHGGTLGSMLLFFRKDIAVLLRSCLTSHASSDFVTAKRQAVAIVVITGVTALVGLGLRDRVEMVSSSPSAAGIGFLLTALFLFLGERFARREESPWEVSVRWWHFPLLGLVQGLAVWPGLSRSGSTIALALLLGWSWKDAGRFSFLMALPAILGAMVLEAKDMVNLPHLSAVLAGITVSFVVGCLSLTFLMKILRGRRLWPFAVYCLLISLYGFSRGF